MFFDGYHCQALSSSSESDDDSGGHTTTLNEYILEEFVRHMFQYGIEQSSSDSETDNPTHTNISFGYDAVDDDDFTFYYSHMSLNEDTETPPLPSELLDKLPSVVVTKEHVEKGLQCTICLENIELRTQAVQLLCQHLYHKPCIVPWLKKKSMCPMCRHIVKIF